MMRNVATGRTCRVNSRRGCGSVYGAIISAKMANFLLTLRQARTGWRMKLAIVLALVIFHLLVQVRSAATQNLPDTIEKIKPAIVGIGTFQRTRRPPSIFRGTGFVIGDGLHIATNAHVLPDKVDGDRKEILAVFAGKASAVDMREATKVAEDRDHDIAILKITGRPLTAMSFSDSNRVREGENYAFTGFPIGMVLGLNPVTHRAIVSAITPIVIPQLSAQQLDRKILTRLSAPYNVFQLDATAYPGNSGSPLYHPENGQVVGIINKVFIQETKESVIQKPSGISYAIPINYVQELLKKSRIE
jgi:S1-C subfamily serine protease